MIKVFQRLVIHFILKIVYRISALLPIQHQKVVFATYRSEQLKDNFFYVHQELEKKRPDSRFVFLLKRFPQNKIGQVFYVFHLMKATYHLATARMFIIDDYYYPVYVSKLRKGTFVFQLWHACGAFKKFGYSVIDKSYGSSDSYLKMVPIHRNYSRVYVSGDACVFPYAEAFGMENRQEHILPLGVPRTDQLIDPQVNTILSERFYECYPHVKGKKIILFSPTFRGTGQTNAHYPLQLDFHYFDSVLGEEYILLLRMHPFVLNPPVVPEELRASIIDVTQYPDINDLLIVSDYLVTDYSSVIFEFALLNKPIILLANDVEEYMEERDFYFDFVDFIPGPLVEDFKDVILLIQKNQFDLSRIEQFKNSFFSMTDGKATERIVADMLKVEQIKT